MKEKRPAVTGYGLLVWSLRQPHNRYLSCQIGQCGPDFALLIRDHSREAVLFAKIASDMSELLSVAKLLRVAYVSAGWQPCRKRRAEHASSMMATA